MLYATILTTVCLCWAVPSAALKVSFYNDARCEGTLLGSRVIELGGANKLGECFQDFAGDAKGAKVEGLTDEELESRVSVDFYSVEACGFTSNKDIISETDGGCVTVGALGLDQDENGSKTFRSFSAVSPGGYGNVPFTDEERELYPGIDDPPTEFHGRYSKSRDGKIWRYQQIAEGSWRGVPAEEWDDNVHVKLEGSLEDWAENGPENEL